MTASTQNEVAFTTYKDGAIRAPSGELIAFFDAEDGLLHIDSAYAGRGSGFQIPVPSDMDADRLGEWIGDTVGYYRNRFQ